VPSAARDDAARLSARSRDILRLIAEGKTTVQIAGTLRIAESTAKTHRRNLMRKLGVSTKADLIRYAIRQGIVES
jgi:DNA-binding CsgD family transcriptional regulator